MAVLANTDQWGTYHVGDRAFCSKLEAIMHSRRANQPIDWRYQHDVFQKYNWTQEPPQSLWDLYSERAHQLRDKYDYIMLMYSGGADSNNVLDAFEQNNIPIDEIRFGYAGEISDPDSLKLDQNREIYHAAIPKARELQKKWPHLKVTIVDMKSIMIDHVARQNDLLHFGNNMAWNPWQRVRFGISMSGDQTWIPNISKDKRVGILWGKDKTNVFKINNKYAVQFFDRQLNGNLELLPDNCQHEYFYWSADSTNIVIKQGHVLKNFFRQADSRPGWFEYNKKYFCKDSSRQWLYNKVEIAGQTVRLNNACYNTLIYPYYEPKIYDVGKLEWQTVSQIVQDTFYHDQNLRKQLNDYLKQSIHWYKDGYMQASSDLQTGPLNYVDRPWFLET